MVSQSSFKYHIWSLKIGTSQGGAMCVLFHHAVAREDNHPHLSAASWLAPLVQRHDMTRSFQHIQLALNPRQQRLCVSERH